MRLSCCPPPSSCFPITTRLLFQFRLEVLGSRGHFCSGLASLLPHWSVPGLPGCRSNSNDIEPPIKIAYLYLPAIKIHM